MDFKTLLPAVLPLAICLFVFLGCYFLVFYPRQAKKDSAEAKAQARHIASHQWRYLNHMTFQDLSRKPTHIILDLAGHGVLTDNERLTVPANHPDFVNMQILERDDIVGFDFAEEGMDWAMKTDVSGYLRLAS